MKATSKITIETFMKPVEVETKTIILELTVEEAKWIECITHIIGGHPLKTPRGMFDELGTSLRKQLQFQDLVTHDNRNKCFHTPSIYFNNDFDFKSV